MLVEMFSLLEALKLVKSSEKSLVNAALKLMKRAILLLITSTLM